MIQLDSTEARKFAIHLEGYEGLGTGELVKNGKFDEIGADVVNNGGFTEVGTDVITNGSFANTTAGNIISNPNFTDTGTDLVVDGDFPPTSTAWTLINATLESGGVRINNGATTDNAYISQTISGSPSGKSFVLTYDVIATNGGKLSIEQLSSLDLDTTTTGTNRELYFTWDKANDNIVIKRKAGQSVDITIDNVKLQELGGDWTPMASDPDGVSFDENGLTIVQSSDLQGQTRVYQSNVVDLGKSYKVTYTIHSISLTSGNSVEYYNGATYVVLPEQGVGTHTFYYTRKGTNGNWYFNLDTPTDSATDFVTISNLTVELLGEDWTRGIGWSIGDSKAISTQALGGELITNGDFSATGGELITNGNFTDTGTDLVVDGGFPSPNVNWTFLNATLESGGVNINNPDAVTNAYILQSISGSPSGKSFVLTYDVLATNGELLALEQLTAINLDTSTTGTNRKLYFTWDRLDNALVIRRKSGSVVDITIDNVKLQELGEDWVVEEQSGTVTFENDQVQIISDGTALQTGLKQDVLTSNKSYKVTIDVHSISGTLKLLMGGNGNVTLITTSGIQTFYLSTATITNNTFYLIRNIGDTVDVIINSVSVQELGEDWTLESGWSINENGAYYDGTGGTNKNIRQNIGITDTKSYKIEFTVSSISAGEVAVRFGGMAGIDEITATAIGTYTGYITANSSANGDIFIEDNDNAFVGSVSSISVKEIATSYLTQTGVLTADKTWMVIYSAVVSAGTVSATEWGSVISATNTIIDYVKVGATTDFRMVNIGGYFEGSVTGIFAYLVDPLGYWTLQSGWAFSSDRVTYDAVTDIRYISQLLTFELQKSYKIQFTISGGTARLKFTNESDVQLFNNLEKDNYAPDSYILYGTAIASTELRLYAYNTGGGEAFSITDISIQEQDPNDYWTITGNSIWIGNKESVFENVAQVSNIKNTSFSTITGDDYRMTFKIPDITKGALNWYSSKGLLLNSTPYKAAVDEEILDFIGDGSLGVYAVGGNLDNSFSMTNLSIRLKDTGDVKLTLTNQLTEKVTTVDLTPITYNGRYTEFAYQPIDLIEGMYMIKFTGDSGTYANTLAYITTGTPPLSESEYKAYTTGDDNPDHVYIP